MSKLSVICLLALMSTSMAFTPSSMPYTNINQIHTPKINDIRSSASSNLFHSIHSKQVRNNNDDKRQSLQLNMAPATGAAAMMGVVSGGILGGALHAIAGEFVRYCWEI